MTKVVKVNGGWGNKIEFTNFDKGEIYGFCAVTPKRDDLVELKKPDGTKFWFRFVSVGPCYDPPDMFFAEVEDANRIPKRYRVFFTIMLLSCVLTALLIWPVVAIKFL